MNIALEVIMTVTLNTLLLFQHKHTNTTATPYSIK